MVSWRMWRHRAVSLLDAATRYRLPIRVIAQLRGWK